MTVARAGPTPYRDLTGADAPAPASNAAPIRKAGDELGTVMAAAIARRRLGGEQLPSRLFAHPRRKTRWRWSNACPASPWTRARAVRGFGGAAGNVLIDGERPATKDDSLDQILNRIPASAVARIEVIRGGAPGIDMQGKTVIANVVRRSDAAGAAGPRRRPAPTPGRALRVRGATVEGSAAGRRHEPRGIALLAGHGFDDGVGHGPRSLRRRHRRGDRWPPDRRGTPGRRQLQGDRRG